MTRWKQLDAMLSTEAGASELNTTLDALNVEGAARLAAGETLSDVPMHPNAKREIEKVVAQLLTPSLALFASSPTSENFNSHQDHACAMSVAWLYVGYYLGGQHANDIEKPEGEA